MTDVRVRRVAWSILAGLVFFAMASSSPQCSRTTDPSLSSSSLKYNGTPFSISVT